MLRDFRTYVFMSMLLYVVCVMRVLYVCFVIRAYSFVFVFVLSLCMSPSCVLYSASLSLGYLCACSDILVFISLQSLCFIYG